MFKAELTCGKMRLHVEGDTNREVVEQVAFWSELPEVCPLCQGEIAFYHRKPQQYNYYGLRCDGLKGTVHETTFGIHNNAELSLFYKGAKSWEAAYGQGDEEQSADYGPPKQAATPGACAVCGKVMPPAQVSLSEHKYGKSLCPEHQKAVDKEQTPAGPPKTGSKPPASNGKGPEKVANEDERSRALEWIEFMSAEGHIEPPETKSLLAEFQDGIGKEIPVKQTRALAIISDLAHRHSAVEKSPAT